MNLHDSVRFLLTKQQTLADLFYTRFLQSRPDARPHLEGLTLHHQAVMLTMGLMISERQHTGAYPATESYLRYLGTRHHVRGVPQDLYAPFVEVFLEVLAEVHGQDWDEALAAAWRSALAEAVRLMLDGYETHYTV
jgi:hemoglobin-like flavoprotein